MLIEFASEENLKEILRSCSSHYKDLDVMALQSPFLWFRAVANKKEKFTVPETQLVNKDGEKFLYKRMLHFFFTLNFSFQ